MKSMSCRQLGGACEQVFRAETFEEMAEMSKQHGMQMMEAEDEAHLAAMQDMKERMQSPAEMQLWFEERRAVFQALPDEDGM